MYIRCNKYFLNFLFNIIVVKNTLKVLRKYF